MPNRKIKTHNYGTMPEGHSNPLKELPMAKVGRFEQPINYSIRV